MINRLLAMTIIVFIVIIIEIFLTIFHILSDITNAIINTASLIASIITLIEWFGKDKKIEPSTYNMNRSSLSPKLPLYEPRRPGLLRKPPNPLLKVSSPSSLLPLLVPRFIFLIVMISLIISIILTISNLRKAAP